MGKTRTPLTVRLPQPLYEASKEAARRRKISLSRFIHDCLAGAIREETRRRLHDAFGEVGADAAGSEVEFAREAQAEVIEDAS
jgi:hypothetical protein